MNQEEALFPTNCKLWFYEKLSRMSLALLGLLQDHESVIWSYTVISLNHLMLGLQVGTRTSRVWKNRLPWSHGHNCQP